MKTTDKGLFSYWRQDLFAAISVFLISLPITIGIAVASNAPPAAGVLSAIVGTLFFGVFSSSQTVLYGPAAGLCVFIAAASEQFGSFAEVSTATVISGLLLIALSRFRVYRITDLIPGSVVKGMVCGIGLTLVFKMFPHLLGTDGDWLKGLLGGANIDASEPLPAHEGAQISWAAAAVSIVCLVLAWLGQRSEASRARFRQLPYAFIVIVLGSILAFAIGKLSPEHALTDSQMLHLNMSNLGFETVRLGLDNLWPTLKLALVITLVIVLEGNINLDIAQKLDPRHRTIRHRREFLLVGIANAFLGFWSALPVMPILIRSSANVEFGARTRLSAILQGVLLVASVGLSAWFELVPIAAVAALLVLVGINLIDVREVRGIFRRGRTQAVPFVITVVMILATDLLWGLLAGLALGLYFSVRSTLKRTMVLVQDDGTYLLRFFKDVSFIHKSELKDHLNRIPEDKPVTIDGTGNVVVDPEIEDFLEEYRRESAEKGREVIFTRSRLAISKLFKEAANG